MLTETIETCGHTTRDGVLNLTVNVGVPDAEVSVIIRIRSIASAEPVDDNGWPQGFFERVAGSMPELQRAAQGQYEERLTFE